MVVLKPDEIRDIGVAAILHDVGKLKIPDEILNKPGKLTTAEYEVMKEHAAKGYELIAGSPALRRAAPLVRSRPGR